MGSAWINEKESKRSVYLSVVLSGCFRLLTRLNGALMGCVMGRTRFIVVKGVCA